MTADRSVARMDVRPGLAATLVVCSLYGGVALSVDFPRVAFGFQSDEATYYMMAHSLAADGDLTYRRDDLVRSWEEFPGGPSGLFLKRGRDVQGLSFAGTPPFVALVSVPDLDGSRLFFGKSFAYPLAAAPFVAAFGTNGFVLLNTLLIGATLFAGYLFLHASTGALQALLLAGAFVFASVAPSYVVWITPEAFNLATVTLGFFCWLFKLVAPPSSVPAGLRWTLTPASDAVAALLLGVATFSKPSNVLLIGPILAWLVWRRAWRRALLVAAVFAIVVAGFFTLNIAITGDWNFQGGERRTYYGGYPFQTAAAGFEVGLDRATNQVLTDVIFGPESFAVFLANLVYFFVGRHSGLIAYFFPAIFALAAFLADPLRRAGWQYLVLAAALAEILLLIVWIPYNYFGGGGVLGNRYFMNIYGLFLFLIPPASSPVAAVVSWIVGGLFTAQLTLNPFYSAFNPEQHPKRGPLRLLPVEKSLFNDLPIMTEDPRVRLPFGTTTRFQLTFVDDNAFIETAAFWVRGDSTADVLVRHRGPAVRSLYLTLAAGASAAEVSLDLDGEERTVTVPAGEVRHVTLPLGEGFPYGGSRIWTLRISCRGGFIPMFVDPASTDNRFLGIRVTPELLP